MAAGAACASFVAVVAQVALRPVAPTQAWFLIVEDNDGSAAQPWQGAEIARECGAGSFEMIPELSPDEPNRTRVPLERKNGPSLNCIIEKSKNAGLWFGVRLEPLRPFGPG